MLPKSVLRRLPRRLASRAERCGLNPQADSALDQDLKDIMKRALDQGATEEQLALAVAIAVLLAPGQRDLREQSRVGGDP